MQISANMGSKLKRISDLEQKGYAINKANRLGYITLTDQEGRKKRIFGLPGKKSPVGFSWIAFLFAPFVYAQIKEWSYFYVICITTLAISTTQTVNTIAGVEGLTALEIALLAISWLTAIYFSYSYPYHRNIKLKLKISEQDRGGAIASGILLYAIAILPSKLVELSAELLKGIYIQMILLQSPSF